MAGNKIDIASLTKEQFNALKSGEVVLVPVDFIADSHKYDYQKTISAQMKKEFGDANFMSASKLGEILRGQDKESIIALKEVVKTLDPIKNAAEIIKYTKMISSAEARQAAFSKSDANAFGTAVHRIIELVEKEEIGKGGFASDKEIIQYLRGEKGRTDKELEIITKFIKNEKGEGNSNTKRALENVRQYFEFKNKVGLQGEVLSEQHIAAFVKVGEQIVKIAGTFDQLWKNINTLTDLKTSAKLTPEYGMQLNAYARLIEAATGVKPSSAKILQIPRAVTSTSGINEVKLVSNEQVDAMLGAAYKIYTQKEADKRVEAIEEAQKKNFEMTMGFNSRLERIERQGTMGKWTDTLINGRSITGRYAQTNWTPKELVDAISLLHGDEREDALRLVFGTVDYETDLNSPKGFRVVQREKGYHYNDGVTKDGKEVPGFWYNVRKGLIDSDIIKKVRNIEYIQPDVKYKQGFFKFDKNYWNMYNSPWAELGYGQSIAKEQHKIKFNTEEDYIPDWYDATPRDKYGRPIGQRIDKTVDLYDAYADDRASARFIEWSSGTGTRGNAVQTGNRIARLVDLASRIDNYFDTLYKKIGFEGSFEERQKITTSWLAENNPALYEQYKESQVISSRYSSENISSLPKEQQISWIIEQANKDYLNQVEEYRAVVNAYTNLMKETPSLKEDVVKNFHPEKFGKTSPYMLGEIEKALIKTQGIGEYGDYDSEKYAKQRQRDINLFNQNIEDETNTIEDFDDISVENQAIIEKLKDAKITDSVIDDLMGLREVLEYNNEELQEALLLGDKAWEEVDDFYKDAKGNAASDFEERKRAAEALLYTDTGEDSNFLDEGISDYVAEQYKIYEQRMGHAQKYNEDIKKIRDETISALIAEKATAEAQQKDREEQDKKNDELAQEYARKVEAAQKVVEAENQNVAKIEQQVVVNEAIITQKQEEQTAVEAVNSADFDGSISVAEDTVTSRKKKTYKKRKSKGDKSSSGAGGGECCENVKNIETNVDKITNEYFPSLFEWLKGVHEAILSQSYGKTTSSNLSVKKGFSKQSPEDAYNKALKEEYSLRLKIEQLKYNKEHKAQTEEEIKAYESLIGVSERELKVKEEASKKAAAEVKDEQNKNHLLSRYDAEHQLKLAEMARKAAGGAGSGGQKQSIWNQMGWNTGSLTRTITQFFSLYRVLGKVRQSIQRVITITKQLDQAATNIRIVTGQEREEVDNTILSYGRLAEQLGTTTTALANSANTWLRQGYSVSESMDLIESSTKLSKLGMLDMNSATKVLTSTLKGFKMEASEAGTIVDKLTKLDMNYAASAGEIGEAMARTSAIASQMGMSLDETAAMVTTIMDVTQQSSEMAGTAVRSILSRYGNVKAGSFVSMMTGDDEDLEKVNDIEKVLNVLGISIRTSKMEMRDMSDVLDDLALKWNTLSSVEQNAVATAFAGELAPEHIEMCA